MFCSYSTWRNWGPPAVQDSRLTALDGAHEVKFLVQVVLFYETPVSTRLFHSAKLFSFPSFLLYIYAASVFFQLARSLLSLLALACRVSVHNTFLTFAKEIIQECTVPNLRVSGNRLTAGSWSMPFKGSSNGVESMRQSTMAAPVETDPGIEIVSKENTPMMKWVPSKEITSDQIARLEKKKPTATSMVELAAIITRETEKLEKYLKESGSSMPGFDVDSPANFPKLPEEIKKAREEIVRASKELGDLVTGPTESVRWMAWDASIFFNQILRMNSLTGGEGYEVNYLLDNYDWAAIDAASGTVVDIGGSHGFVCVDLAKRYKNMKFVVQDLPKTVNSAPMLDPGIADRITFQAHDFHTLQPVKGADVYFYRWILHNQADKHAINMLKQLIPVLKKGARVVINDHCLPEPNTESAWDERIIRTMDLIMLTLLNAQERTEGEFRELFKNVDPRFRFLGVTRPEGCRMSIVEVVWDGEDFVGEGTVDDGERPNGELTLEEEKSEEVRGEEVEAAES